MEFYKTIEPLYELIFDYSRLLNPGETLKDSIVYVNSGIISTSYDDRLSGYWDDNIPAHSGVVHSYIENVSGLLTIDDVFTETNINPEGNLTDSGLYIYNNISIEPSGFINNSGDIVTVDYWNIDVSGWIPEVLGDYDNIMTFDQEIYNNDTILLKVNSGVLNSTYEITISGITNRRNIYGRTINVIIDEYAYPDVYNDFEYSFLVDDTNVYIVPAIYDYKLPFLYNTEYTININKNIHSITPLYLEHNKSFWFTSKYCPMFTSSNAIVLLLGPEAEKFTVDTINRYIHRTSKEAIDLINMSGPCGGTPRVSYDFYGCTPDGVPYNLRRYVECKVAYDLLNLLDRLRTVGGSDGGQTKTLGDMSIKYGGSSGSSSGNNDVKDDLYDCFTGLQGILSNNPTLCGTGAGINNGVRGKYDTSKGFAHPTMDVGHNRINRPMPKSNGPWNGNGNSNYPGKGRL